MSEERVNASIVVPRTMILAVLLNGLLGFGILIAVLFCDGDLTAALASPTGYPFIEIFYQGTGSLGGANGLTIFILIICITSSFAFIATASRLVWAFSRDRALPGWRIWNRVSTRHSESLDPTEDEYRSIAVHQYLSQPSSFVRSSLAS